MVTESVFAKWTLSAAIKIVKDQCFSVVNSEYRKNKKTIRAALTDLHEIYPKHKCSFDHIFAEKIVGTSFFDMIKEGSQPDIAELEAQYKENLIEQLHSEAYDVCEAFVEIFKKKIFVTKDLTSPLTAIILSDLAEDLKVKGLSLSKWSESEEIYKSKLVLDDNLSKLLEEIRTDISDASKTIIRFVGSSGVGKTRIVYEAFNSDKNGIEALKSKIVYFPVGRYSEEDIIKFVRREEDKKSDKIIIVDDCTITLHHQLSRIVNSQKSKLRLITIDYNVSENEPEREIPPVGREVIKGIINNQYPSLDEMVVNKIIRFSQGYPVIATRIASSLSERQVFDTDLNDTLLNKMIWQRDERDSDFEKVLCAFSIFSMVGYSGELKDELEFVRGLSGLSEEKFYEGLNYFKGKKIIQGYGRFYSVQPLPISLRMATKWWKNYPPEKAAALFSSDDMPRTLLKQMCEQLKMLDRVENSKELVVQLCEGGDAPFAKVEVLDSEWGSECFYSLVVVNPVSALNALEGAFGGMSIDELREIKSGRRHLVWSLEKLVFRNECFRRAAMLLLKFAAAENESWGNNATGQFSALFHVILPGTEASLSERADFLEEVTSLNDGQTSSVAIKAIGSALETHSFSRSGGAEEQGTRTLKDYHPSTWGEIREYFSRMLSLLFKIIDGGGEVSIEAARCLTPANIRNMAQQGLFEEIVNHYDLSKNHKDILRPNILSGIADSLAYDSELHNAEKDASSTPSSLLEETMKKLWPKSIEDRLQLFVIENHMDLFAETSVDDYGSERRKAIEGLARDFANEVERFLSLVPLILLKAEGSAFELGSYIIDAVENKTSLFESVVKIARSIDNRNDALIKGMIFKLDQIDRKFVEGFFNAFLEDPSFQKDFVDLTTNKTLSKSDLDRLMSGLNKGFYNEDEFYRLIYGGVLKDIPIEDFSNFINTFREYSSRANFISLSLLASYTYGKRIRPDSLEEIIQKVLLGEHILDELGNKNSHRNTMHDHYFEILAEWVIEKGNNGKEFTEKFVRKVMPVIASGELEYSLKETIRKIFVKAFDKFPDEVWSGVAAEVLKADPAGEYYLKEVISDYFSKGHEALITKVPSKIILEWCKRYPNKFPQFIAKVAPPLNADKSGWNPIILGILDSYGENDDVLKGLNENMGNFVWSGGVETYYKQYLQPLESIKDHKNRKVRDWARVKIKVYNAELEKAKKEREEEFLGIY